MIFYLASLESINKEWNWVRSSSQRRLCPRSSYVCSRYHGPRVPVTALCVRLLSYTNAKERERERGGERGTRIPQFLPCKHDPVLSSISPAPLFSFICPSSSASLGGLRNWPGIDISGPSRAQNPSCTTAFSLARFLRSPPSFHPIHLLPPSNHRLAGIP